MIDTNTIAEHSCLPEGTRAIRLAVAIPAHDLRLGDILLVDPSATPVTGDLVLAVAFQDRKTIAEFSADDQLLDPRNGSPIPTEERAWWSVAGTAFGVFRRFGADEEDREGGAIEG